MLLIMRLVWTIGVYSLLTDAIEQNQNVVGEQRKSPQSRLFGPSECQSDLGSVVPMRALGVKKCPQSKEVVALEMKLYTRNNSEIPQVFKYNQGHKINQSNFNPSKLTRMVVHGFGGNCDLEWIIQMRRALLNHSDINLFCADWRNGTIYPDYAQGAANTQIAGKLIAIFFNDVGKVFGPIGPKLHLIGFSFGAQVCSFAGSNIPNCSRISGLDPAGPSFREHNTSYRLDKTDADFVDVIHTNGRYFLQGAIGLLEASGDVDFYPFGGETQPYCKNLFAEFITGKELGCSHYRAVYLFLESIRNESCKMIGFPCFEGWPGFRDGKRNCFDVSKAFPLGLNTPRNATGELYLTTRTKEPYCGNQLKVRIAFEVDPSWFGKLYKRNLQIIYESGEKVETFTIASGFTKSGIYSRVMTVDASIPIKNISLKYTIGKFFSLLGRVDSLKIFTAIITDVKDKDTFWRLQSKDGIIKSGTVEKLMEQ